MPDETTPGAEQPGDRFAVTALVTPAQAAELFARDDLDFGCRPRLRPDADGTASLVILASRRTIDELRAKGHRLTVGENVSAAGRARLAEVGRGDRFEGGRIAPSGLAHKHLRPRPPGGSPGQAP